MSRGPVVTARVFARLWPLLLSAGCAAPPAPPKPSTSYVMLIQSPDGSTGEVIVRDERGSRVLNRAGQAAGLGSAAPDALEVSAEQAGRDFGVAKDAQPPLPERYVVNFESNTTRVTRESARRLDELVERLTRWPAPELQIIGHTDTVGTRAFNERLAMERARVVAAALAARGVASLSMQLDSRGEREPVVETADEVDEPRNRRVEVWVR